MKINKTYVVVGLIIAFTLFFELAAHADLGDQLTTITFNEPVQIPGQVLPAGTYLFKLADSDSERNIVQIFNADRTVLYATLQTIPAQRREPTDDTTVTFADQGAGRPEALLKWFYPGNLTGNEFLYSDQREKELAHAEKETIVANQSPAPNPEMSVAGK